MIAKRAMTALVLVLVGGCTHVPRDMVAFFNTDACPKGWAAVPAEWQGRYAVIGTEGTARLVGHPLSAGENRATGNHQHAFTPGNSQVLTPQQGCNADNECRRTGYYDSGDAIYRPENARLRIGAVTVGPGETTAAGTNAPYVALKACAKG